MRTLQAMIEVAVVIGAVMFFVVLSLGLVR